MGEHTPTPWLDTRSGPTMRDRYSQPFAILQDGKPNLVAGCFGDVAGGEEVAEANAAFIVEAVNSYDRSRATIDALVGALHLVDALWTNNAGLGFEAEMSLPSPVGIVWQRVRAALQLARGGAKP